MRSHARSNDWSTRTSLFPGTNPTLSTCACLGCYAQHTGCTAETSHEAEFSLHSILKAYEQVLPKYDEDPSEDVHYYRLLLKLSLDPTPCWWAKFQNECMACG